MSKTLSKTIALVGHCGPDSSYLHLTVTKAVPEATIVRADDESGLQTALGKSVDLLLLNRQLDFGFDETSGVELFKRIRKAHPTVKAMLVSNFPEAQSEAVASGALSGFGKRELGSPRVGELLRAALQD